MSATTTISTSPTATTPDYIPRGPVEVELSFYKPPADNSTPYYYVEKPPADTPSTNFSEVVHKVPLTDIRGHEADYTLDQHAVQVLQDVPTATSYTTFDSDSEVERLYYPEVTQLLLTHVPGARRVILFDHTIRRQSPTAPRQPVNRTHVDQTRHAARERIRLHLASTPADVEEAERVLRGEERARIINVWRPLNGPVQSAPLAFAAAPSVDNERDLVAVEHRYPHRTGETMSVRYNPVQQWMYLSGVREDERLLLQCSDTHAQEKGVAERAPHSAFWDPRTPEGARPRESIEVRALVLG